MTQTPKPRSGPIPVILRAPVHNSSTGRVMRILGNWRIGSDRKLGKNLCRQCGVFDILAQSCPYVGRTEANSTCDFWS